MPKYQIHNDIESLVCQALNTVYEALGNRHGNDPDFVDKITNAANEWAQECVNCEDESPQQMGWVGSDGQP